MQVLWSYQIYGFISSSSSIGICGGGRSSGSSVLKSPRPMSRQSNHSHVMAEVFAPELSPDAHLLSPDLETLDHANITYIHTYIHTYK